MQEENKMNVDDVKEPEVKGDRLIAIFTRQKELMKKYHEIEKKSGIGYGLLVGPFNLHEQRSQALIKDLTWRVVEEITECMDCLQDLNHAKEEASDSLHFLVELLILCDITPDNIAPKNKFLNKDLLENIFLSQFCDVILLKKAAYNIIHQLGLAMNCLKQKPWKQTHVLTDVNKFKAHLIEAFHNWIVFARSLGMNPDEVYSYYFRKSEVNKFRIKSAY